jgi:hypothetical protein
MLGNNNIHILGISETKLKENHLRKDRYENRGCGLLVYIKGPLS